MVVDKVVRVGASDALEDFLESRVGVPVAVVVRDCREKRKRMPRRDLEALVALRAFMTGRCAAESSMAWFGGKEVA